MPLPYDPADPPAHPPDGCVDPLLWKISYALNLAHQPRADGWCDCREFHPCAGAHLAGRGFFNACTEAEGDDGG